MERFILIAGIALCLFSLWALARHDWLRLTRPMRRITAEVIGHRTSRDLDDRFITRHAAIYRFCDESGEHEVVDPVYSAKAEPSVGTRRELAYPAGHPELARPPRAALWAALYLFLIVLGGLLAGKLLGFVEG